MNRCPYGSLKCSVLGQCYDLISCSAFSLGKNLLGRSHGNIQCLAV